MRVIGVIWDQWHFIWFLDEIFICLISVKRIVEIVFLLIIKVSWAVGIDLSIGFNVAVWFLLFILSLIADEAGIGCLEALVSCDLEAIVETVLVDKGSDSAFNLAWTVSTNPALIFADEAANLALSHLEITLLFIKEVHLLKIDIDFILFQVISQCFTFSIFSIWCTQHTWHALIQVKGLNLLNDIHSLLLGYLCSFLDLLV
mgnify:CR=1 FL=1